VVSVALILGAGWSYCAGLPLARELFDHPVGGYTDDAANRLAAVFMSFKAWRRRHPDAHAEEFVTAAFGDDVDLVSPALVARRPQLEFEALRRLPWPWVVEYIQVRLSLPVPGETRRATARYAPQMHMPTRSSTQQQFWSRLQRRCDVRTVVTTNYDLLAERTIRHRPTKRPSSPGFHYGGITDASAPSRSPFGRERRADATPSGRVPLFKLHGSLNWSVEGTRILVYPDVRPAFRRGGTAAIIPPLPEKEIPDWLAPSWELAEFALAEADEWVVVGYSLPEYDIAVMELLRSAASAGRVERVMLHDPCAQAIASRWSSLRPALDILMRPALPPG
jgi:hypothetical protein